MRCNREWAGLRRVAMSFVAVGLGCAAALVLVTQQADAVVGAWSSPLKLSGDTRHAWFPSIAADDADTVHVVWTAEYPKDPRQQIDALWYARSSAGKPWSTPTDISVVYVGDAVRNAITVDSAGRVHLIYKGFGKLEPPKSFDPPRALGPEDLWYTSTSGTTGEGVHAWGSPHQITRSALGYYADLKTDSHGVLHVIWTESDNLGWGLYYARSTDGGNTWSDRIALDDSDYVWWYRAHLMIDAQDRLHVVWEVTDRDDLGRTRAALYAGSADGGTTWSKVQMGGEIPHDGSTAAAGPQQPAVGIDGTGQIIFLYRELETDRLFYRVSPDGQQWSTPQLLPGVRRGVYRPYDVYDMVTDGAGHVHLAFVGYPEGSDLIGLLHAEWNGRTWGTPDVISAGPPLPYPEYPKVAISGGNRLHVVWFGGDRESVDRLAIGVWYSSMGLSTPHAVSAAAAVPTPAIAPTWVPVKQPAPDRLASRPVLPVAASVAESVPSGSSVWSPPSSLPIFVALVPVIVLLSLVGLGSVLKGRLR